MRSGFRVLCTGSHAHTPVSLPQDIQTDRDVYMSRLGERLRHRIGDSFGIRLGTVMIGPSPESVFFSVEIPSHRSLHVCWIEGVDVQAATLYWSPHHTVSYWKLFSLSVSFGITIEGHLNSIFFWNV